MGACSCGAEPKEAEDINFSERPQQKTITFACGENNYESSKKKLKKLEAKLFELQKKVDQARLEVQEFKIIEP